MAAALFRQAVLVLFVQRPPAAAAAVPPGRLTKPAGPVSAPARAVRGGRLMTI